MAITSGFFDSVEGDRTYDAEQMTTYFEGLISDGIYENIGEAFIVKSAANGLDITVGSGRALVKTHWIKNDAPITITLSAANVQYPRIDSIFLRYDSTARTVDVVVVEGTPSASPTAPQPRRTETTYDLFLASVHISKNASAITQSAIHDNRGSSACPWITGLIKQVDTSNLFLQYQAAYYEQFNAFDQYLAQKQAEFNAWFSDLTGKLQVDTTLHEYQDSYTITSSQEKNKIYPFTLENYEPDSDILFVIVDGIVMVKNVDFKIIESNIGYPDINGDGTVDTRDSSLILDAYTNMASGRPSGLTPIQEKLADVNMDGKINPTDAGLVNEFYSATSTGVYTNDLEGWKQFMGIPADSEYCIVPLKGTYRAGSQMTIRIIKSVVGEGSSTGLPANAMLISSSAGTPIIGNAELNQTVINLSSADFEEGDISDGVPYPSGKYIRSAEFINLPADADSTKLSITLTPAADSPTRYWVCGYDSTGTWVRTSSSTNNNQMCTLSLSGISKIKLVIGYTQSYNLSPSDLVSATLTIL